MTSFSNPRLTRPLLALAIALAAWTVAAPAHAVQTCELAGRPINPDNGNDTAGKTGLMRCRDADSGAVMREQELRDGKSVGIVRYFKSGQVEREFSVNERGNREGLSREWRIEPGSPRQLVREQTDRNGHAVGIVRTWYPGGERRRLTFYGDDERELAVAEFNPDGHLSDLRCATQPRFGSDFDDATACGHDGKVSTVLLYGSKGQVLTRIEFERGERRKIEVLGDNGAVRESRELTATGRVERVFAADSTKLRETQWITVPPPREPASADARPRSVRVLDQEFHTSGKLLRETRWAPSDRLGAELVSESTWYLNGQPKDRIDYAQAGDKRSRRETRFHDNGKTAFEGTWLVTSEGSRAGPRELPNGTHKSFDERGRLRTESVYDDRGRITREREFDEAGGLIRDDEVFEDGSRKSTTR